MKKEAFDVCLKISEDAVIKIARLSALEINGVSDIGKKAVSVKNLGGVIEIDIEIYITTLEEAQAVAGKIQYAVKDSVQSMTGIPVSRVCVRVLGIGRIE